MKSKIVICVLRFFTAFAVFFVITVLYNMSGEQKGGRPAETLDEIMDHILGNIVVSLIFASCISILNGKDYDGKD